MKNNINLMKVIGQTISNLSAELYRAKVSNNIFQKSIVSVFLTLTFLHPASLKVMLP